MMRMGQWLGCLVLAGACFAALACTPAGPPGDPTPTATAPRFSFDPAVPEPDRQTIEQAVALMRAFLDQYAGGAPRQAVTVSASPAPGSCKATGSTRLGAICLDTGSAGWTTVPQLRRLKTVAHEYYHALQFEIGCTTANTPLWLLEGSAEYMAATMLAQQGLDTAQAEADADIAQLRSAGPLPPLEALTFQADQGVPGYSIASLAVQQLVEHGGVRALRGSCESSANGLPFDDAFRLAFGATPAQFSAAFAQWVRQVQAGR